MTSFASRVAKLIKRLRFLAQYDQERQRLYKLDFPVKYYKLNRETGKYTEHSTYYVLCSNSIEGHCEPETMLFPATWRGRIKSMGDLAYAKDWNEDKNVLLQLDVGNIIKR